MSHTLKHSLGALLFTFLIFSVTATAVFADTEDDASDVIADVKEIRTDLNKLIFDAELLNAEIDSAQAEYDDGNELITEAET